MAFTLDYRSFELDGDLIHFAVNPWDSQTFGINVFDLRIEGSRPLSKSTVSAWLSTLPSTEATLVCAKIDPRNIPLARTLCQAGFYPVETILTLDLSFDRFISVVDSNNSHLVVREAAPSDLSTLVLIARQAFTSDRFHLDPSIGADRSDDRFEGWIRRAFEDNELILVMDDRDSDQVVGFFHVRSLGNGLVDGSLAAVSPDYKRTGLSSILFEASLAECQRLGFERIQTHTSVNNQESLNVAFNLGFLITEARLTLHWFSDG